MFYKLPKKPPMPRLKIISPVLLLLFLAFVSCKNKQPYKSPAGYDIKKPEKLVMKNSLREISGIAFISGKEEVLYAIEDEAGKLFSITPGSDQLSHSKFAKKGDYEDVTILNDSTVAVLKSNGSFYLFSINEIGKEKMDGVKEYEKILPEGEYEGLSADSTKLIALCKNCPGDKEKKEVSVYTLQPGSGDSLTVTNTFKIDITLIQSTDESSKEKFHPSGIAKNPITHEWYIISSVNKLLLILDEQWKAKEYYSLDPSLFKQPEGITFNSKGDLYISNEGGDGDANILIFRYKKK